MSIIGVIVVILCIILNHHYKKQYPHRRIALWLLNANVFLQIVLYVFLAVLLWKADKFTIFP
jgi:hypothetical protein